MSNRRILIKKYIFQVNYSSDNQCYLPHNTKIKNNLKNPFLNMNTTEVINHNYENSSDYFNEEHEEYVNNINHDISGLSEDFPQDMNLSYTNHFDGKFNSDKYPHRKAFKDVNLKFYRHFKNENSNMPALNFKGEKATLSESNSNRSALSDLSNLTDDKKQTIMSYNVNNENSYKEKDNIGVIKSKIHKESYISPSRNRKNHLNTGNKIKKMSYFDSMNNDFMLNKNENSSNNLKKHFDDSEIFKSSFVNDRSIVQENDSKIFDVNERNLSNYYSFYNSRHEIGNEAPNKSFIQNSRSEKSFHNTNENKKLTKMPETINEKDEFNYHYDFSQETSTLNKGKCRSDNQMGQFQNNLKDKEKNHVNFEKCRKIMHSKNDSNYKNRNNKVMTEYSHHNADNNSLVENPTIQYIRNLKIPSKNSCSTRKDHFLNYTNLKQTSSNQSKLGSKGLIRIGDNVDYEGIERGSRKLARVNNSIYLNKENVSPNQ